MNKDQSEFLEECRLKVKEHSEFIDFPIEFYVEKSKEDVNVKSLQRAVLMRKHTIEQITDVP